MTRTTFLSRFRAILLLMGGLVGVTFLMGGERGASFEGREVALIFDKSELAEGGNDSQYEWIKRFGRSERGYPTPMSFEVPIDDSEMSKEDLASAGLLAAHSRMAYLLETMQLDRAESVLDGIELKRSQWPPQLALQEIQLLLRRKNLSEARKVAQDLIDSNPGLISAYLLLAQVEQGQNNQDEVVKVLEKARKVAPRNRVVLENLGRRYRNMLITPEKGVNINELLVKIESVYADLVEAVPGRPTSIFLELLASINKENGKIEKAHDYMETYVYLQPRDVEARIDLLKLKMRLGRTEEMMDLLRRGVILSPNNIKLIEFVDTALKFTLKSSDDKKHSEAVAKFYQTIAEEFPGRDDLQLRYARILLSQSRSDEAIEVLRNSLVHSPSSQESVYLLAELYSREDPLPKGSKDYDGLLKTLKSLIEEEPRKVEPYIYLVQILGKLDRTEEAIAPLKSGLDYLEDDWAAIFEELAFLYLKNKRYDEFQEAYESNISRVPKTGRMQFLLADYYVNTEPKDPKEYDELLKMLKTSIEKKSQRAEPYIYLVRILGKIDRSEEAIAPLKSGLDYLEGDLWAVVFEELASLYLHHKRYDGFKEVYERYADRIPETIQMQLLLADYYLGTKQKDKLTPLLEEIAKAHDEEPKVLYHIGMLKWDLEDFKSAETLLRKAIDLDPEDPEPLNSLGYLLCERDEKRLDEALSLVQKAVKLDPDRYHILDSLGWIQFKKGNYPTAIEALEKAVKFEASDPVVQEHLAFSYLKDGNANKALTHFKTAIELMEKDRTPENQQKITELNMEVKALEK